jgi:Bardet-Biedl syndrome 1 protein
VSQVWRGTARESEHALLGQASAICSFVPDEKGGGGAQRPPVLAIAAGPHVYMLRSLKPFYRFCLPPEPVHPLEEEAWCARAQAAEAPCQPCSPACLVLAAVAAAGSPTRRPAAARHPQGAAGRGAA